MSEQIVNAAQTEREVGGYETYWNEGRGGVMWRKKKGETPVEVQELGVFSNRDIAFATMSQYLEKAKAANTKAK